MLLSKCRPLLRQKRWWSSCPRLLAPRMGARGYWYPHITRAVVPSLHSAQEMSTSINHPSLLDHTPPASWGLFGLGLFHGPGDLSVRAKDVVEKIAQLRRAVLGMQAKRLSGGSGAGPGADANAAAEARRALLLLDAVSSEVCSICDAAELCLQVHADEAYRAQAAQATQALAAVIHSLNADEDLYRAIVTAMQAAEDKQSPSSTLSSSQSTNNDDQSHERQYVAWDLRREFESGGVHLPEREKRELLEAQSAVAAAEGEYLRNINSVQDSQLCSVDLAAATAVAPGTSDDDDATEAINAAAVASALGPQLRRWLEAIGVPQISLQNVSSTVTTTFPAAIMLSNSIEDDSARRKFWAASRAINGGNLDVLGRLIQSRHRVATQLGFASHAHKYLANKVYTRPEEVLAFLRDISDKVRPRAEREHEELVRFAARASRGTQASQFSSHIPVSDAGYWSGRYKQHLAAGNPDLAGDDSSTAARGGGAQAAVAMADYLSIDDCLRGLCLVTRELFGVQIEEAEFDPGEAWCHNSAREGEGVDPRTLGLRKFIVRTNNPSSNGHRGSGIDGIMYLDMFSRENKFTGAAHFTVQAGCGNVSPLSHGNSMHTARGYLELPPWGGRRRMDVTGERQIPIIALVFNFEGRKSPSSSAAPRLSSLSDLVTLYHEWGHGLHSLLSRTTFQHVSGTRGGVDVSEIPSHLFEYFARDARVVRRWARHASTGLPPPEGLVERALSHRNPLSASETLLQIYFSAADQYLFGPQLVADAHQHYMKSSRGDSASAFSASSATGLLQLEPSAIAGLAGLALAGPLVETYTCYRSSYVGSALQGTYLQCFNLSRDGSSVVPAEGSAMSHAAMNAGLLNLSNHNHFIGYGGGYFAYIYARICAAQIWHHTFSRDPLNRSAGDLFSSSLLRRGAAVVPHVHLAPILMGSDAGNNSSIGSIGGASRLRLEPEHFLRMVEA